MLKPFVLLLKALSSNTSPGAIAHAFACGMMLGFIPKDNLFWYALFIFIFFMRIQRAVLTLAILLGAWIGGMLDVPLFHVVGDYILTLEWLWPFFNRMMNMPFTSFTALNNTIVMGAFACGVMGYIPFYALARLFVWIWRHFFAARIRKLKALQVIKNVPAVQKIASLLEEV